MVSPEFEKSLFEGLQSLEATLKDAKDEMQSDCRGAAITSLQGVVEFINSIPRFESQNLSLPVTALMAALHDLNVGRVGAMVTPTAGFDNRKPEASFRKVIKAYAIFCIDLLKGAGMTIDEACKFVASELKEAHVPIGGRSSTRPWKTVKNWRYDVTRPGSGDRERPLQALRAECEFPKDLPLDQLKKRLAQLLRLILPQAQRALG